MLGFQSFSQTAISATATYYVGQEKDFGSTTISSTITYNAPAVNRTRNQIFAIVKDIEHTAALNRTRTVGTSWGSTITNSTPAVTRTRRNSFSVNKTITHSTAVNRDVYFNPEQVAHYVIEHGIDYERARTTMFSVANSIEKIAALNRERTLNYAVLQVFDLAGNIERFRDCAVSVAQSISIDIDIDKRSLTQLSFAVEQSYVHTFASMRRIRTVVKVINEAIEHYALLARTRSSALDITQQELLNWLMYRTRMLAASLTNLQSITPQLSRVRDITNTINQLQTITINATRIKMIGYIVEQAQEFAPYYLERTRKIDYNIGSIEDHQAIFNRARAMVSHINEDETVALNIGRLREQVVNIAQTQGIAAALGRLKVLAAAVELYTDLTIEFDVIKITDIKYQVTMSWNSWQVVSSDKFGAVIKQTAQNATAFFIEEKHRIFKTK